MEQEQVGIVATCQFAGHGIAHLALPVETVETGTGGKFAFEVVNGRLDALVRNGAGRVNAEQFEPLEDQVGRPARRTFGRRRRDRNGIGFAAAGRLVCIAGPQLTGRHPFAQAVAVLELDHVIVGGVELQRRFPAAGCPQLHRLARLHLESETLLQRSMFVARRLDFLPQDADRRA